MATFGVLLAIAIGTYCTYQLATSAIRESSARPCAPAPPGLAFPTVVRRYVASLVDVLFVLAVFVAVRLMAGDSERLSHITLSTFTLLVWYDPLLTSRGCTLGQWIAGLRVRNNGDTDEQIPIDAAVVRFVVKWLLGPLSVVVMPYSDRRRAVHDLAARSVVVQLLRHPKSHGAGRQIEPDALGGL